MVYNTHYIQGWGIGDKAVGIKKPRGYARILGHPGERGFIKPL
jgi:hypothetical protein